jgi:hypothetical protein
MHVRFQCERLALLRKRRWRWLLRISHQVDRCLFAAAAVLVWLCHGRVLRAGGLRPWSYAEKARQAFQ